MGHAHTRTTLLAARMRSVLPLLVAACLLLCACAGQPPGATAPKEPSTAFAHPEETALGRRFLPMAQAHPGASGLRLVSRGVDGFWLRAQLMRAAERSIDLQSFIIEDDETSRLLTEELARAADRGVRVRVLVDDAETPGGSPAMLRLRGHPGVQLRIFNPFAYRGGLSLFHAAEFVFGKSRLDSRMHNKLLVVDGAAALVGGRNVGDGYFQVDPEAQFGDSDVFCVGPAVGRLSASFDEYWNSTLAIPAQALAPGPKRVLPLRRDHAADGTNEELKSLADTGRLSGGLPLAGILDGSMPLIWAPAQVLWDSPYKLRIEQGRATGPLLHREMAQRIEQVRKELIVVTPYFVPGDDGMKLLKDLLGRGAKVRVLTNSLESTVVPEAHSGYMHYRRPLLTAGAELHEARAQLGRSRGSGASKAIARSSPFFLHAKVFVFDRASLFIGSMNFDQRSMHLNTEVGLVIDSPELARQAVARFEALIDPKNSYRLTLEGPRLTWRTEEEGRTVAYSREPGASAWQRFKAGCLSLLPLDKEL